MMKPRVLIFSLAYLPQVGGAEVAVKEITGRLPQFEFEIITADLNRWWSKYLFPFWAYRRGRGWHQWKKYDLVWAIMANQAGMAAAMFRRRFPAVPFLLTLQEGDDLDSFAYRMRLLGPRFFGVFRRADQITAISNYLARWARKMGASCPITVVPNGVDLEKFKGQKAKVRSAGQNSKVIITTSRLVQKNGIDTLIESLRYLPANIRLRIVGNGPLEQELKLKAKSGQLASRIDFVDALPPAAIAGELERADVFVRPSRSEGLGNSFLEAMAAGLPVVGTPVGGIPDFLREGETGWFCRVNNPESIAEKVKYILEPVNTTQVVQVTQNAHRLVEQKYTWPKITAQIKDIFNVLIK